MTESSGPECQWCQWLEPCPVDASFLLVPHSAPLFLYLPTVENGQLPLRVWEKLYQTIQMHCVNFTTL